MEGVELRHLRYFVAVAEELSFTRAAERLHIAQPPLSTQIRNLERSLSVTLIDRSRRTIALTEAGRVLLGEARPLLMQLEQALRTTARAGRGEVGRLTVGFVPSASNAVLPDQLRAFHARYPQVELLLREMPPDDLVAGLHAGTIDVSFLYLPFHDDRLAHRTVARDSLVAALPVDHPLARDDAPRLRIADLADEPFVLPARHQMPGLNARVLDACRRAGFEPRGVQKDVWLLQTVLALVASGLGVALLPQSAQALGRSGVSYHATDDLGDPIELGMFWRADNASPTLDNFRSLFSGAD